MKKTEKDPEEVEYPRMTATEFLAMRDKVNELYLMERKIVISIRKGRLEKIKKLCSQYENDFKKWLNKYKKYQDRYDVGPNVRLR